MDRVSAYLWLQRLKERLAAHVAITATMKNASIGFTFRELQYIVAVAEELNFHKAAVRCCVSQSTLSIQLR